MTPNPTSPIIEANNLTVAYDEGKVVAVDAIGLTVTPGEVVGVLGGNGAGKTSTLRTFSGVNPPHSGSLIVAGFDMTKPREADEARKVVGYCPDVGGLVRQATVREHIGLALALRGKLSEWGAALQLVEEFNLSYVLDREAGGFSHGMSRRLSVVLAALTAQSVLVLDEPFDGVDPMGVEATERVIRRAKEAGVGVVVSTHLLPLLTKVSERVLVMSYGNIVAEEDVSMFAGEAGELRYQSILRDAQRAREESRVL